MPDNIIRFRNLYAAGNGDPGQGRRGSTSTAGMGGGDHPRGPGQVIS